MVSASYIQPSPIFTIGVLPAIFDKELVVARTWLDKMDAEEICKARTMTIELRLIENIYVSKANGNI